MKNLIPIVLFILFSPMLYAQKLPDNIQDQPDGITFYAFGSSKECLPELFIGSELQILFPCYSKKDYKRIDISTATKEIARLKEIMTESFIQELNHCCEKKQCPDTVNGYYLMYKKGSDYVFQYLDKDYATEEKCGSKTLSEIIDLLNKINENYRG